MIGLALWSGLFLKRKGAEARRRKAGKFKVVKETSRGNSGRFTSAGSSGNILHGNRFEDGDEGMIHFSREPGQPSGA
jgi:hypothetical protein